MDPFSYNDALNEALSWGLSDEEACSYAEYTSQIPEAQDPHQGPTRVPQNSENHTQNPINIANSVETIRPSQFPDFTLTATTEDGQQSHNVGRIEYFENGGNGFFENEALMQQNQGFFQGPPQYLQNTYPSTYRPQQQFGVNNPQNTYQESIWGFSPDLIDPVLLASTPPPAPVTQGLPGFHPPAQLGPAGRQQQLHHPATVHVAAAPAGPATASNTQLAANPTANQIHNANLPNTYAGRRSGAARQNYPWECTRCGKRFLFQNSAHKHVRHNHSGDSEATIVARWVNAEKRPPPGRPRNATAASARAGSGAGKRTATTVTTTAAAAKVAAVAPTAVVPSGGVVGVIGAAAGVGGGVGLGSGPSGVVVAGGAGGVGDPSGLPPQRPAALPETAQGAIRAAARSRTWRVPGGASGWSWGGEVDEEEEEEDKEE